MKPNQKYVSQGGNYSGQIDTLRGTKADLQYMNSFQTNQSFGVGPNHQYRYQTVPDG